MVICAAFGCKSRLKKNCSISFFSFPPPCDRGRREIWRHYSIYCRRVFDVQPHHKLCSRLVSSNIPGILLRYSNPQARLRKDAFPDIPLEIAEHPLKKTPRPQRTAVVKHRKAEQHQTKLIENLHGKSVTVGGDGHCDSPGYSAKY